MNNNKKPSQTAGTVSEVKVVISQDNLQPIYHTIECANEIVMFSKEKGWTKEQLKSAVRLINSLEDSI